MEFCRRKFPNSLTTSKVNVYQLRGHCLFHITFTLLFLDVFPPDTLVNQADQSVSCMRHHLAVVNVNAAILQT